MTSFGAVAGWMAIGLAPAGGLLAWDQLVRQPRAQMEQRAEAITGGSKQRGRATIQRYGCAGCHHIPGIPQRGGGVGPPLEGVAVRAYVGGKLENRPDNMMRWIADPQAVSPGTAMPDLGLTPAESRDVSAYLYTLG